MELVCCVRVMSMKKTNKRAPTNGFDSSAIDDRLKKISRIKTEGDWRHIDRKKLVMTVLIQKSTRTLSRKTTDMKQICPWGMVNIFLSYYQRKSVKSKCYFNIVFFQWGGCPNFIINQLRLNPHVIDVC